MGNDSISLMVDIQVDIKMVKIVQAVFQIALPLEMESYV